MSDKTTDDPVSANLLWRQWAMQQAVLLVATGMAPMTGIKTTADSILDWVKETHAHAE